MSFFGNLSLKWQNLQVNSQEPLQHTEEDKIAWLKIVVGSSFFVSPEKTTPPFFFSFAECFWLVSRCSVLTDPALGMGRKDARVPSGTRNVFSQLPMGRKPSQRSASVQMLSGSTHEMAGQKYSHSTFVYLETNTRSNETTDFKIIC